MDKIKNFWKQKNLLFKIKLVFGIVMYLLSILIIIIYFVLSRFKQGSWPVPNLEQSPDRQDYVQREEPHFQILLKFPDLPMGVKVGGQEQIVTKNSSLFLYQDPVSKNEYKLVVAQQGRDEADKESIFSSLFSESNISYEKEQEWEGYLNTLHVSYECGILIMGEDTYYVLSYRYDTGVEKDIVLMVMGKVKDNLKKQKEYLDQIFFSLGNIKNVSSSEEQMSSDSGIDGSAKERDAAANLVKNTVEQIHNQEKKEIYEEILEMETTVEKEIGDGYFVFSYTEDRDPSEIYLVSPTGTVYKEFEYKPLEKELVFHVKEADVGVWTLRAEVDGMDFGYVTFYFMEKEVYDYLHDYDQVAEEKLYHPAD